MDTSVILVHIVFACNPSAVFKSSRTSQYEITQQQQNRVYTRCVPFIITPLVLITAPLMGTWLHAFYCCENSWSRSVRQRKGTEVSGDVIHTNYPAVVVNEPLKVSMVVTIHTWKLNWDIAKKNFQLFCTGCHDYRRHFLDSVLIDLLAG